ncbi:ribbon-helix-helix protein, CopG family [Humibacter antri]
MAVDTGTSFLIAPRLANSGPRWSACTEISALDARADREGKSRSEVIREALASA